MAAVPARPAGSRTRHRKRFSVSRLSSDTTATLPEYRQETSPTWNSIIPDDEPPDYPDSANEADEETDEYLPLSPSLSPRRKRFARLTSKRNLPYQGVASQSDTFLDSLLERSVNALELSNALLHSSMTAQSSLSNVLEVDQPSDRMLDARARGLSRRIQKNRNVHERWMDDLDDLAKDVEDFMDDAPVSHSLPSSSPLVRRQRSERKASLDLRHGGLDMGHLVSNATTRNLSAPPPRALTQYVSVRAEQGDALEETSDRSHIFLPSTIGLRSPSHVSDFSPPHFIPSSSPESSPVKTSLVRRHSGSPSPHFTRNRSSRSPTPTCSTQSRSRSRSWSSNKPSSNSPKTIPRLMPPPIEELPSQSDSSSSDNQQPFRTVEQLRKILVEQTPPPKEPSPTRPTQQVPSFSPRSPPVAPVTSTSTTTTSISRLYSKGSHSTTTRATSPPRMSSLKKRPSPLNSAGPSTLSIPDLANGSASPAPSSGRSTPRNVAFGPLPEPHRERPASGGLTKFQEQKEAKSRARRRRNGESKDKGEKEKEGESSWWTTWLTGGSLLSMSAAKQEERAEDRMARWSRPGMGVGFEDWPV